MRQADFSGACEEPSLEGGFSTRSGFASAFLPNCSALSPPSFPRFSVFVLLSFRPPRLPWPHRFALITTRPRRRSTQCAVCSDGARLRSLGGSGPTLFPSTILPPGSLCSSSPISSADWRCRFRRSFCCCWRSSGSNSSISCPTPSSRWPSLFISVRCLWGWQLALPSFASFLCW
jgi:hypothetical protein